MIRIVGGSLVVVAMTASLGLAGCSSPALDDRFIENPGAEAFLDRIAHHCGKISLGDQPIDYLLENNSDDTFFVDETSKLYFGNVDRPTYASDINAFYPTDRNQRALDCIFAQLGQ